MAKATIRTASGTVITVEGTEAEVSNIVSTYERAATVTRAKGVATKQRVERKEGKKRSSASDLIVELKEDGYFEKPKTLGDISKALEEKGFLYPVTSLSGVVLGMVQKRELRRKKAEGRWVYGK